jgi:hypothetical protein
MDEQSLSTKRRLKRLENLIGGGGGGGAGLARLSRLWFIDGGTTQTGNTGSIAEPFSTIAKWTAAMGTPANSADASVPLVGYLTPSENVYTEATVYPRARNILLMTDPFDPIDGTIVGNATWANTTDPNQAAFAQLEERNVLRIGDFTVTDDATASISIVLIAGTNLIGGAGISGTFTSNTTQHLEVVELLNAQMHTINCGSGAANAQLAAVDSSFLSGTITAFSGGFLGCTLTTTAITVHNSCSFNDCTFQAVNVLTTGTGTANANFFDGPSWRSFLASGSTRATGVIVLVTGGFYAGPVYGKALPTGAGPTAVSLNGNGATAGYTGSDSGNVYVSSGLTADSVVQVLTSGGESVGDTVCITKTDLAAHTLTIKNNANTTIGVIPSGGRGSIVMVRAGATAIGGITNDWALSNAGSVAA